MKELQGTEKQIIWATTIKESVLKEMFENVSFEGLQERHIEKINVMKSELEDNCDSKFWIDNFQAIGGDKVKPVFNYLNEVGIFGRKLCKKINEKNGY